MRRPTHELLLMSHSRATQARTHARMSHSRATTHELLTSHRVTHESLTSHYSRVTHEPLLTSHSRATTHESLTSHYSRVTHELALLTSYSRVTCLLTSHYSRVTHDACHSRVTHEYPTHESLTRPYSRVTHESLTRPYSRVTHECSLRHETLLTSYSRVNSRVRPYSRVTLQTQRVRCVTSRVTHRSAHLFHGCSYQWYPLLFANVNSPSTSVRAGLANTWPLAMLGSSLAS